MLEATPNADEIKKAVFEMNAESAPGPDSFSGIFYKTCWHIIQEDFVNEIQYFWRRKYEPRGLNSNFLILLPKTQNAKKPGQFRPISLRNFSFKVFTKIISTRLSGFMGNLVSPQQAAYIKRRSIHEQVMMASELVNKMKHTRRGVMVNGGPQGFFSTERGLKHVDPLSPILFVLMEEILSRGLKILVEKGKLQPMVIRKGCYPTHLFFADDVFIFYNGSKRSLEEILTLLKDYQENTGQLINKQKIKCFVDGCNPLRKDQISNMMQMELTTFPDKYLGVILKPVRVNGAIVCPMVEMMQKQLSSWKGKLLSFHDRLILIKSDLSSIPVYNMVVHRWPKSVIKVCEK
ncbi:uncharacterized protein LOC113351891 [Papaver somniferum]|uniref:uncharacterized protein LOC113351891 n=1 Tax=Papaver somniferum TaxID=3469 RepID=UPI000E6FF337|nr:uncharacterized protein LOC113351891 [Papaver somniferum]